MLQAVTRSSKLRGLARRALRIARWPALALLVLIVLALVDGWTAFGHRATGARRARMERSPQWKNGHFENPEPLKNDVVGSVTGALASSPHGSPKDQVPVAAVDVKRFAEPPPRGLRVTWFGHSSLLVEIDGRRILTDPVWSERIGPMTYVGPTRWYAPLVQLLELPAIDAVLVSHDHYDHLDQRTIQAMKGWTKTRFVVPLGVGAHLAYWGIPEERIVELDWWETTKVGDVTVACTPARHASGRQAFDKDATLWAGYALVGPAHRVYFSGDTGLFPAMKDVGERYGPFDMTMIETGQYHQAWPDWHIGPEQAVVAHKLLRGKVMLPMHWGLVQLAYHGWTEPVERVLAAAQAKGVTVVTPRPGESVEPDAPKPPERWWPSVEWKGAKDDPIVSTQVPRALVEAL
jgi:L-ascorbate metabolism protein UlaG (beta-lactamase superfamily)